MAEPVPERPSASGRVQACAAALVGSPRFWRLFVAVIAAYPFVHVYMHPLEDVIPILERAPGFRLQDSMGEIVGIWDDTKERQEIDAVCVQATSAALKVGPAGCKNRGLSEAVLAHCRSCDERVADFKGDLNLGGFLWLAAPVCVRGGCPGVASALPDHLFQVQHRARGLGKHFRIIGLPTDRSEVGVDDVANYARDHRVSRTMWKFTMGPPERVREVMDAIFGLPIPGTDRVGADLSGREYGVVALVDPGSFVRGYYDIRTGEDRDTLLRDMGLVGNRGY